MEPSRKATNVRIRAATLDEVLGAKGGFLYRSITYPWRVFCKIIGTLQLLFSGTDFRYWKQSIAQKLEKRIALWRGQQGLSFLRTFYDIYGRSFVLDEQEKIAQAIFNHHRNDGLFLGHRSYEAIFEKLQQAFPEEDFKFDDFVLTCDHANSGKIRKLLSHNAFNDKKMRDFSETMSATIDDTLKSWSSQMGGNVEITLGSRLYATSIFCQLLFGKRFEMHEEKLADSIKFMNEYIIKRATGFISGRDNAKLEIALAHIREMILDILNEPDLPVFKTKETEDEDLTETQKKAMIFALLFAGQETTAALLSYIIWQLALDPDKQEELYRAVLFDQTKKIEDIFTESIRKFSPAAYIGRKVYTDICVEYLWEGDPTKRKEKIVFFKGDGIIVNVLKFAQDKSLSEDDSYDGGFVFGSGIHTCPGKKLAFAEITQFISSLIRQFVISTEQKEVAMCAKATLTFTEPIFVTLSRRER